MKTIHRLDISWATSRGRDTYGYNICRLDDSITRTRYRTCGGGYDMIGTVLGNWFEKTYPEKLKALKEGRTLVECGYSVKGYTKIEGFCGLTFKPNGEPQLDGGTGDSCMQRIIKACGFDFETQCNRNGHVTAYYVSER